METVEEIIKTKSTSGKGWEANSSADIFDLTAGIKNFRGALKRQRTFVLGGTIVFTVLAVAVNLLIPRKYEGVSYVTIVHSRPRVELVETDKLRTGENEEANQDQDGLVTLLYAGDVLNQVLQKVQAKGLAPAGKAITFEDLTRSVHPKFNGSVLTISYMSKNPVVAANVSNIWAETYVDYVNQVYGISNPENIKDSLKLEYDRARATLNEVQARWIDFVKKDDISILEKELEQKEALYNSLVDLQQLGITKRAEDIKQTVSQLYAQRVSLRKNLDDASLLAQQIESEKSVSTGSHYSLILLKMRIFSAPNADTTTRVELGSLPKASEIDSAKDLAEVRELKRNLQEHLAAVELEISSYQEVVSQGFDGRNQKSDAHLEAIVTNLKRQISNLREQQARQQGLKQELESRRVIAQTLYDSVASKWQQSVNASNLSGNEVRLASEAFVPSKPVSPRSWIVFGLYGAVLGLFIFGGLAFLNENFR